MNINNDFQENLIKYYKKGNSSISSAKVKSKHRHIYDKIVLLAYKHKVDISNPNAHIFVIPYTYCSICGKIGKSLWKLESNGIYDTLSFTLAKYKEIYPDAMIIKCDFNDL